METTYTAEKNMILENGEIYLFIHSEINHEGLQSFSNPFHINGENVQVTHSTESISGVIQLDRNKFIKSVDLGLLENEAWKETNFTSLNSAIGHEHGFLAGYNANNNEFTKDEVVKLMSKSFNQGALNGNKSISDLIKEIRPLSLPQSVKIENNEIIDVKWN